MKSFLLPAMILIALGAAITISVLNPANHIPVIALLAFAGVTVVANRGCQAFQEYQVVKIQREFMEAVNNLHSVVQEQALSHDALANEVKGLNEAILTVKNKMSAYTAPRGRG